MPIDDPFDTHDVASDLDVGRERASSEDLTPPARYEVLPVSADNIFKVHKVAHNLDVRERAS